MQANKSNYKPQQPDSPKKINANLSPRGKQSTETPSVVKKIKLTIPIENKGGYTPTLIAKNNKETAADVTFSGVGKAKILANN